MRIIGVTGGVGAGKSTVLQYMEEAWGASLILADHVAHELMEPGSGMCRRIQETFGGEVRSRDGGIDRKRLGDLVFADEQKRVQLNGIVHPSVKEEILRRIGQAETTGKDCVVVEAALFLEEKYDAFCDETWYIYTNEDRRRARLKVSRGYTDERIDQMFQSQKSHEEFLGRCDYVIDNNGTAEETCRQIDRRMMNR